MQQNCPRPHVVVQSQTWSRDSHGLFDYESQTTFSQAFTCEASGHFCRTEDQLVYLSDDPTAPTDTLASLRLTASNEVVLQPRQETWLAVRFMGNGLELTQGQVLRLGRVKYQVKSLYNGQEKPMDCSEGDIETSDEECAEECEKIDKSQALCRVCWERETDEDPLLSQCRCSGSIQYIHLDCLRRWLSGKVVTRESEGAVSYTWKALECEVCKTALPLVIHHKGKSLTLFQISKPDCAHIVLETEVEEKPSLKCVHVIPFEGGRREVRLGRGHDSDVRINDISVSRCHAIVRLHEGRFVLEDCSSKFGTLLKVTQELKLGKERVTVQMGRSLVALQAECS